MWTEKILLESAGKMLMWDSPYQKDQSGLMGFAKQRRSFSLEFAYSSSTPLTLSKRRKVFKLEVSYSNQFEKVLFFNSTDPFSPIIVGNPGCTSRSSLSLSLVEFLSSMGIEPCTLEFKYMFNLFPLPIEIEDREVQSGLPTINGEIGSELLQFILH
jgi:hypothetical protein